MTRLQPPVCPTCLRRHWEIVSTARAAQHVHIRAERFRKVIKEGHGPRPWAADVYKFPRYHVAELDRWLQATSVEAAA